MVASSKYNKILINTHRHDCIDLLKSRDYYFNKARSLYRIRIVCILIPLLLLAITYAVYNVSKVQLDIFRDYILFFITLFLILISWFIQSRIDKNLKISNMLREEYDLRVFEIAPNLFSYDRIKIKDYLTKAQFVPDNDKYEVWYSEIFCNNHFKNIICAQLDNCLYTYYVYKETKKLVSILLVISIVISLIIFMILYYLKDFSSSILFLMSMTQVFLIMVEAIKKIDSSIGDYAHIIDKSKSLAKKWRTTKPSDQEKQYIVRCLQDCIIKNRDHSLFILKYIRNKYLKSGNPYYIELDTFKELLMGTHDSKMIESAVDIPIVDLTNSTNECTKSEDVELVSMIDVHNHLKKMLLEVTRVWEDSGIRYTLDGGTLIGAVREKGKMLFWDDDVDVLLPYTQVNLAQKVILEKLGDKYEVQNCINDRYYSPRLANFRIREKNKISMVSEKDSPLYKLYNKRGLFLDVYTYSPIFINRFIDSLCRFFIIHPFNMCLKQLENESAYSENLNKRFLALTDFISVKRSYLRFIDFYSKLSRNKKYVTYTANYIYTYRKTGPYVKTSDIIHRKKILFEGEWYYIPVGYENILKASYGDTWNISPYKSKEKLIKESLLLGNSFHWYSRNKFFVSVLKHLTYVKLKVK